MSDADLSPAVVSALNTILDAKLEAIRKNSVTTDEFLEYVTPLERENGALRQEVADLRTKLSGLITALGGPDAEATKPSSAAPPAPTLAPLVRNSALDRVLKARRVHAYATIPDAVAELLDRKTPFCTREVLQLCHEMNRDRGIKVTTAYSTAKEVLSGWLRLGALRVVERRGLETYYVAA